MDAQRGDDTSGDAATRTEETADRSAGATEVVSTAGSNGGEGATRAHAVPTPREAPDDATSTVGAGPHPGPAPQGYGYGYGYGPSPGGPGGPGQWGGQWGGPRPGPWGPPPPGAPHRGGAPWGPPQAGPGAPPWGPPPAPPVDPEAEGRRRRRRRLVLAAVAVVVVAVLVVVAAVLVDGALTRRTAERALADAAGWSGATYRGQVDDGVGGPAAVEMTVDAQGNAAGTMTRASGGRAEFVLTRTNQAIRADEAWWARSAPRPRLATKLGGLWLSGASDQLAAVSPWAVAPRDLAGGLSGRSWSDDGSRQVGAVSADVLAADGDPADRVAVDDTGDVPRLAEVEPASFGPRRTSPVATEQATPEALGTVGAMAGQVPAMTAYGAAVAAPPLTFARIDPIPDCFTPTCPVTVRVSNIGRYRTTGTLTVLVNDVQAATFGVDAAPGAVPVFTATVQNQAFNGGPAQVTVRVTARLSDLE